MALAGDLLDRLARLEQAAVSKSFDDTFGLQKLVDKRIVAFFANGAFR
ncbi:MAG: hypothetical protein ACLT98_03320 [Eggerthellaceae bacterium]